MTKEETRQLTIEFERRVQTMIPATEFGDKLDTETILSYLNQYQDKYIHDIYKSLDSMQPGSKIQARFESILQAMLTKADLGAPLEDDVYELPEDFGMYIKSISKVNSSYKFKQSEDADTSGKLANVLLSLTNAHILEETPNNKLRIMRNPIVTLSKFDDTLALHVMHDIFTDLSSVELVYYKQPRYFDLSSENTCELPMDAFDDLVSGAVDLYVNYVAGAEARKRQQQEAALKRAREDLRDARRSGGNQDEQQ